MPRTSPATEPHPDPAARAMGRLIQQARKAAGYATAADLARELGISVWTVHSWEAGKSRPRYPMLAAIARLTGQPLAHFLGEAPSPTSPTASEPEPPETGVYGLAPYNRAAIEALTALNDLAQRAGLLLRFTTPVVATAPPLQALHAALSALVDH